MVSILHCQLAFYCSTGSEKIKINDILIRTEEARDAAVFLFWPKSIRFEQNVD